MNSTTSEQRLSLRQLKEKLNLEMYEDMFYGLFNVNELLINELKKPNRMLHKKGYFNFIHKLTSYKTKNVDVSIILYMYLIHRKYF